MPKQLAAVPHDEPEGELITLPNGWVRMSPMSIDALEAMGDMEERPAVLVRAVKAACLSWEFADGRSLGEQNWTTLTAILREWNKAEDARALPPANGQR